MLIFSAKTLGFSLTKITFMKDPFFKITESSNQIIMELTSQKKENTLDNLKMVNPMAKESISSSRLMNSKKNIQLIKGNGKMEC